MSDFSADFEELPLVVDGFALDFLGNGSFRARDGEVIEISLNHAAVYAKGGFVRPATVTTISRPSRFSNKPHPLWSLFEGSILDQYGPEVSATARVERQPIRNIHEYI